ncbi:glycosyltransferase [Dokdonella sp.]|uniref:glycosyltransferase n=1 Tax=Dokdonella sp. TaxID=2291710 RepID=UPI003528F764
MISFVVPAHDEERLIGATLDALDAVIRALAERAEIIVVVDASTDATAAIAGQHGATVIEVDFRHIAATRNAGATAASGDRLFFVDADTRVDLAVVSSALAALKCGAVGGGATVRLDGPLSRSERIAQRFIAWLLRLTRIAPGCFLFCTRAAFDAVGGFDETYFAAEDVAISRALGRHGTFVILREPVRTSARKLRTHTIGEHLKLMFQLVWRGRSLLRSRTDLDLWYGRRRQHPD